MSIRNRPGLADIRNRYIRRAKYLLREDREYREAIQSSRDRWGAKYPRYRIVPRPIGIHLDLLPMETPIAPPLVLDDLQENVRRAFRALARGTLPGDAASDQASDAGVDWLLAGREIADQFWPPDDFPNLSLWEDSNPITSHPAVPFVTACLLFTHDSLIDTVIVRLFSAQELEIRSLPYKPEPDDDITHAEVEAERDVLREELEWIIAQQPGEEYRHNLSQQVARRIADVKRKSRTRTQRQRKQHWWFLPVVPGMSVNDVEAVAPRLVEISANKYGTNAVDRRVRDLLDSGMTQREVANRLGRSERFVRESAWRTRPR